METGEITSNYFRVLGKTLGTGFRRNRFGEYEECDSSTDDVNAFRLGLDLYDEWINLSNLPDVCVYYPDFKRYVLEVMKKEKFAPSLMDNIAWWRSVESPYRNCAASVQDGEIMAAFVEVATGCLWEKYAEKVEAKYG